MRLPALGMIAVAVLVVGCRGSGSATESVAGSGTESGSGSGSQVTPARHLPLPISPPAVGPDAFPCGPTACDARTHYCELINTDVKELPSDWTCVPLPSACTPGAHGECGCFPETTKCRSFCRRVDTAGARGFLLTCIGGG
jgi:hypothetical protein